MRITPGPRFPLRAFSIIELTVVAAVITILAGLIVGAAQNARQAADDIRCLSNIRQISVALRLYLMNHHELPNDRPQAHLARDLGPFLERTDILTCPLDPATPGRSYDPFFVARQSDTASQFLLGCPRHHGNRLAVNLMSESSVHYFNLARVSFAPASPVARGTLGGRSGPERTRTGSFVRPGDSVGAGRLYFEDGSRLTVSDGGRVVLLQSFRKANGVLYTIVKIVEGTETEVDVEVTPGSQFEIITPAAIAGVRGTRFIVRVSRTPDGRACTTVTVREGTVWVAKRLSAKKAGKRLVLRAGRSISIARRLHRRLGKRIEALGRGKRWRRRRRDIP